MELTTHQPCQLFKYRLMELFIVHFGADAFKMRKKFAEENNLSLIMVKLEFNYRINAGERIPQERLNKYARFLNIEDTKALRNYSNSLAA